MYGFDMLRAEYKGVKVSVMLLLLLLLVTTSQYYHQLQ